MPGHRKRVKHYHEPGDCHELTFSCYRRLPLLTNDEWRRMLAISVGRAIERHKFRLVAFVFMPEHVHLLVYPTQSTADISALLKAIKRPYSYRIKQLLQESDSPLLQKLTIRERPGKMTFRYWQEGPGYDRNLNNEKSVRAAIDYIHMNPVRRGLCQNVLDWKWSSAGYFLEPDRPVDLDLPTIHGLPPEFFTDADPD